MKKVWIDQLEKQGCFSDDWNKVTISEDIDLRKIRNVWFRGSVSVGANSEIINVPGGIVDSRIGDNVRIINVAQISRTPDATFGIGTDIKVLDETGHRIVRMYPGISSQIATLSSREPDYASETLLPAIDSHIKSLPDMPEIGDNAVILDCGAITDVRIWPGVTVEGALHMKNGCIVNNSDNRHPLAYVGYGVEAENFIIEDGEVRGGSRIFNSYVGQGAVLDKGFTAHDSMFFANCQMECGEACAVLAGPYSVSMHKSSLLIGVQTSFFNAGSGSNMSNHMYKLGPANWGVMERGVKTASNAYVMQGARIGSFSLVMGDHKKHPDTSEFPFSYLFGNEKGETTVVPAAMLKSYGLRRDEGKWPLRDRRKGHGIPLHDRITFPVLNPFTIGKIKTAKNLCNKLSIQSPGDEVGYKRLNISKKHLMEGAKTYDSFLVKYVSDIDIMGMNISSIPEAEGTWIDLGGQIIPSAMVTEAMNADGIEDIDNILSNAHHNYHMMELAWIIKNLEMYIKRKDAKDFISGNIDITIEKDRKAALDALASEESMLRLL